MPRTSSKTDPEIAKMPAQKMAVVRTVGNPNVVAMKALGALYGSVFTLKFDLKKKGREFKVTGLRARWPNAHLAPKKEWIGIWGLPIPPGTRKLPQKEPKTEVQIERWEYGTVAQILHIGPYSAEKPSVDRLHRFIQESGYEIAGPHEEEYLSRPTAKAPKTIIRYVVRKKK